MTFVNRTLIKYNRKYSSSIFPTNNTSCFKINPFKLFKYVKLLYI